MWANYAHETNIREALFQHISFGLGYGTNTDFAGAHPFAGPYELGSITVSTAPDRLAPTRAFWTVKGT